MGATRWWENYLVRYLMPSIAGVVIVLWLSKHAGDEFRTLLLLPQGGRPLDTPALTLVFLYGNLFCYVASYPVLSFHVTRVLDFDSAGAWTKNPVADGYLTTVVVTLVSFIVALFAPESCRYIAAFLLVALFASVQLSRTYMALSRHVELDGLAGSASLAFGFLFAIAKRRAIPAQSETAGSPTNRADDGTDDPGFLTSTLVASLSRRTATFASTAIRRSSSSSSSRSPRSCTALSQSRG